MSFSKLFRSTASFAFLATSGASLTLLAACEVPPLPPMEAEEPPPNPDVIPIAGDSSGSPETPAPANEDIIPIAGDSSGTAEVPAPANPASAAALAVGASSLAGLSAAGVAILAAHNAERASVGAPPLRWNPILAAHATDYAQQLAHSGQLTHASREGRGVERENLSEGNLWWTTNQMVDSWLSEKRFFHPGVFPNVCNGDWSRCAHYSQMIWPTTTDIGCGQASGSGHKWLVCRYSPGGNKDGKRVGAAAH